MSGNDHRADEHHVREQVRRFKQHLLTYTVVVGMLFAINLLSGGIWEGNWWFLWVAFFWGIAIVIQAVRLFGDDIGRDWEDRTVDRIVARRRGQAYTPPEPPAPPPRPDTGPRPPSSPRPESVADYMPPEPPNAPPSPSAEPPEAPSPSSGPKEPPAS